MYINSLVITIIIIIIKRRICNIFVWRDKMY